MSRTLRVPIFPLSGAILFPRSQLPLHIFEPRYREMVRDAIDGAGRIAMIQPHRLDDGRFNIVLLGSNRFRLLREAEVDAAYRCADVDIEAFDDAEPPPLAMIQRAEIEREARKLGDALGLAVDWAAVTRLDDEMLVNAIAQVAPFDIGAKQALLESPSLDERSDLLVQLMQFQRMAVTGGVEVEP